MAMLVALGGAGISTALGLGPAPGWIIGSVAGNLLFPKSGADARIEGPRLGDLAVTSSAYGAPIAVAYGTLRLAGTMIWSQPIEERRNVAKASAGGKGGGAPKQTAVTYSYFASFAIAFGQGPADDVLRLWADGKLIFDKTGNSPRFSKRSLRFRFHPGDETQLPDPLIETATGTGRAPAHRGLCYLVFEHLPLADFGNRIPSITAEIAFAEGPVSQPLTTASHNLGTLAGGGGVDVRRNRIYRVNGSGGFLSIADLTTLQIVRHLDSAGMDLGGDSGLGELAVGADSGRLYLNYDVGVACPIARIDPDSLRMTASFGYHGTGNSFSAFRFLRALAMWEVTVLTPAKRHFLVVTGDTYNDIGLLDADSMSYLWRSRTDVHCQHIVGPHEPRPGAGFCYVVAFAGAFGAPQPVFSLWRLDIDGGAAAVWNDAGTDAVTLGVSFAKVDTIACEDLLPGSTLWHSVGALAWDPGDDSVIIHCALTGGTAGSYRPYVLKWRQGQGVLWATAVAGHLDGAGIGNSLVLYGRYGVIDSAGLHSTSINTSTGEATAQAWALPWALTGGTHWYDGATHAVVVYGSYGAVRLALERKQGGDAAVAGIVSDLCARAGLAAADIDVASLTGSVRGYVVSRPMTVRAAIEPLASAFFFDGVESDDVLCFRARGRPPVAAILQPELLPLDEETGEAWRERRIQEVELPERVSVVYMDCAADYSQGSQSAKRAALPLPAMHSRNQTSLELPIAIAATEAKAIAEQSLYAAWIERSRYEAALPWQWLVLDPGDVIDVVSDDGTAFRSRLTRVDAGADFAVRLHAVSEDAAAYGTSAVPADGGAGVAAQVIPGSAATRLILADLPLLRDVDDTGGSGSRLYWLMAGYGPPGWPGAALYTSPDGSLWSPAGQSLAEAACGTTVNALGPPRSAFATDEDNPLTLVMATGGDRLESVTQLDLVNGANPALVLKANGEAEIIQFRDVVTNPDGSFTLQGLLRGRRGSDVFVTGHQPGELFVLLDAGDIETLGVGLGELNVVRHWRAVGFGMLFEEGADGAFVHTGRDLKPYAPVHVKAVTGGSPADITLSWLRRSRIGGALADGTGTVPLGEAAEAYEVDILASPGGAVRRTLSSSAPSVTYTQADIVADFGGVPSSLSVVVYQLSAVIGRGFGRAVTLEVV